MCVRLQEYFKMHFFLVKDEEHQIKTNKIIKGTQKSLNRPRGKSGEHHLSQYKKVIIPRLVG